MKIEFVLTAALVYLFFVLILYNIAANYKIKSLWVLLLSFFLTPLTGLVAIMISEKGHLVTIERYACTRCGLEHTQKQEICPHCKKEGYEIPLRKVIHKSL